MKLLPKSKPPRQGVAPARSVPGDPRDRGVFYVREEMARVIAAVDHAKRYASVTDLAVIADVLKCTYRLIDARKDEDGSV